MALIPFYKNPIDAISKSYLEEAVTGDCESFVKGFEKDFCKYIGTDHAVSTINASTALHLALWRR